MFGFFGSKTAPPAARRPDRVVPIRLFDDAPQWRAFVLYTMFAYDDVLDPQMLVDSLEKLVRMKGWWKLGARLRRNNKGELEYHVPAAWTRDRPALTFTRERHSTSMSEHPMARHIPRASSRPMTVSDPDKFNWVMRPADSPAKLEDYLKSDRPQLGLHVVSFADATLVTVYFPHTSMDAMGESIFLRSWELVLAGRDDEVCEPVDGDPLAPLGDKATVPSRLADRRLNTLELLRYAIGLLPDLVRKQECRMVCLPRHFFEGLRRKVLDELREAEGEKAFVSENDVLIAWWCRLALAATDIPRNSDRLIVINNAFSLRKVLSSAGDLLPKECTYVSNAVGFVYVMVSARDMFSKPLGWIARQVRESMEQQRTREEVEAFGAMTKQSSARMPPLYGHSSMFMFTISNWTQANLFETDLSPALIGSEKKGPCVPRYVQSLQLGLTVPNGFPVIGKDGQGNYWMSGYMPKGHWPRVESMMADYSKI